MAVGSGRSTLGSENPKELKRYPWTCHQCLRQSLIANWFSLVVCSCCSPCNGNICTFRNVMWPVVQFYFSNMSNPVQFQLHSGYQVLPPRRRWDLCP